MQPAERLERARRRRGVVQRRAAAKELLALEPVEVRQARRHAAPTEVAPTLGREDTVALGETDAPTGRAEKLEHKDDIRSPGASTKRQSFVRCFAPPLAASSPLRDTRPFTRVAEVTPGPRSAGGP